MSLTRSTELVLRTVTTKAQKEKNFRPLGNPIGSTKQSCSISRVCVPLHAVCNIKTNFITLITLFTFRQMAQMARMVDTKRQSNGSQHKDTQHCRAE